MRIDFGRFRLYTIIRKPILKMVLARAEINNHKEWSIGYNREFSRIFLWKYTLINRRPNCTGFSIGSPRDDMKIFDKEF